MVRCKNLSFKCEFTSRSDVEKDVLWKEVGTCHPATRRPVSVLFVPFNFWESSLICWDHVLWIRNKFVQLGLIHLRYLQFGTMKVKVKFTLEQATKAQRGSRSITLLFL